MHSLEGEAVSVTGGYAQDSVSKRLTATLLQWKAYSHEAALVPSVALLSAESWAEIQAASQMLLSAFLFCCGCLELVIV